MGIIWTDYLRHRADLRGFDLAEVERILRFGEERYFDTATGRQVRDSSMAKTQLAYFEEADVLHLTISDEPEAGSVELSPNITAELNDQGELIGIEILDASAYVRDSILESAQARMLKLSSMKPA